MTRKKNLSPHELGIKLFQTDADPAIFRASMGLLENKKWLINLYPRQSVRGDYVWVIWHGDILGDINDAIHSGGYFKEMELHAACREALDVLIKSKRKT